MTDSLTHGTGAAPLPESRRGAAERLVQGGRVLDVRVLQGGAVVTGIVSTGGSEAQQASKFRVYIRNLTASMQGECSCGQRPICVHVAAVALAASASTRSAIPERPGQSARATTTQQMAARSSAPRQQLCYVLERAANAQDVELSLWVAQVSGDVKSIVPGSACAFVPRFSRLLSSAAAELELPRYVDSADRQILGALTRQTLTGPWRLRDDVGATVLAQIIATGRAFRDSLSNAAAQALTHGGRRSIPFHWELLPNGDQRLTWESSDSLDILASLEPPMYIDAKLHEAGDVELPFGSGMLRTFVELPAVAPERIAEVNARIDRIAGGSPFPRLRAMLPSAWPLESLTPRLFLSADEQAIVYFVYNGTAVDSRRIEHGDTQVRLVSGQSLYEVPRDTEREKLYQAQLTRVLGTMPDNRLTWLAFMMDVAPALRAAGWEIVTEAGFPYRIAESQQWYGDLGTDRQRTSWFNLRLGVIVDGQPVNLLGALTRYLQSTLPGTADQGGGESDPGGCRVGDFWLIRLDDGRYLPVAMERIERIAHTLVELFDRDSLTTEGSLALPRSQGGRLAQLAMALQGPALSCDDSSLSALLAELQSFSGIRAISAPESFRGELRLYQQEGLGWLQFLRQFRLGGVLADDMGLGKTVQTIAHIALETASGRLTKPVLIVSPVSALGNWQQELARFAPGLSVHVWHGAQRRRFVARLRETQIILTAYPLLLIDSEILVTRQYGLVILDEAQMIKNPAAKVSQMARALRADSRLCLSGTPVENHLGELWSLFDFLQPGLLGDERHFQRHYRTPIERNGDRARAAALSTRLAPFLLRRTKDAVAKELPPKVEMVESITLDERQRDFYDGVRLALHQRIQEIIRQQGLAQSQITILDALLKLRQVCCDPRLVNIPQLTQRSGDDAAVIPSAKLEWLSTVLPELVAEGRRILLFSQFTSMLRLIETLLQELDIGYCSLTGETQERASVVARFQSGEVPLFLLSLKAGGTALNLTAADIVIHYDPWWNPAVEAQATDRAHRIGQTKSVFVYKLIAQGTVEERMLQLQADKRGLADRLYTNKSSSPTALTAQDLEMLFAP